MTKDIETRTYNEIMKGLRELGADYPIDQALEEGLIRRNFYDQPEACRYLLWSYEEHLAKNSGTGATVDEHMKAGVWRLRAADSIEHVFPQNPALPWGSKMRQSVDGPIESVEANVSRIGNLLLLPLILNQEARNLPFDSKKEIYSKHHLRMVQEVCGEKDWTLSRYYVANATN
ncbi:MAG: HNH endonuclease family protein [Rhodopila sp.]